MTKLGIVGIGYWGPNYARAIMEIEDIELLWCCDLDERALKKFKKLYPQVKTTSNIDDLLEDKELNGIIIVTPAQTHFKLAEKVLLAGKDVLVEKPLTSNLKDAEKLVNTAKKAKKILMVDHTFLFNPAILKLKEMYDKGLLGKMMYLYGSYNALGPIRRDVSALWDLPHLIYVATYLLGKMPISVRAVGRDYLVNGMDDIVFVTLEYQDKVLFNLYCSWIDPVKIRKMVVVGDKKMVVFDDMQPEERLKVYDKGVNLVGDPNFANLQLVVRSGDTVSPKIEPREPLKDVVLQFVDAIKSRKLAKSSGEDGMNLVKILTLAQKSLSLQGERIWLKKTRQ